MSSEYHQVSAILTWYYAGRELSDRAELSAENETEDGRSTKLQFLRSWWPMPRSANPVSTSVLALFFLSLGGLLQVVGVGLTAWDVHKVRAHFGMSQPSQLMRRVSQLGLWARRNLLRQPTPQVNVAVKGAIASGSAMNGDLRADYAPLDRSLPIPRQIELLDGWVRDLLNRQYMHLDNLRLADAELRSALEATRQTHQTDIDNVRQSYRDLATGGLRLRSWSVFLIIAGTIFLTIGGALAV